MGIPKKPDKKCSGRFLMEDGQCIGNTPVEKFVLKYLQNIHEIPQLEEKPPVPSINPACV